MASEYGHCLPNSVLVDMYYLVEWKDKDEDGDTLYDVLTIKNVELLEEPIDGIIPQEGCVCKATYRGVAHAAIALKRG